MCSRRTYTLAISSKEMAIHRPVLDAFRDLTVEDTEDLTREEEEEEEVEELERVSKNRRL